MTVQIKDLLIKRTYPIVRIRLEEKLREMDKQFKSMGQKSERVALAAEDLARIIIDQKLPEGYSNIMVITENYHNQCFSVGKPDLALIKQYVGQLNLCKNSGLKGNYQMLEEKIRESLSGSQGKISQKLDYILTADELLQGIATIIALEAGYNVKRQSGTMLTHPTKQAMIVVDAKAKELYKLEENEFYKAVNKRYGKKTFGLSTNSITNEPLLIDEEGQIKEKVWRCYHGEGSRKEPYFSDIEDLTDEIIKRGLICCDKRQAGMHAQHIFNTGYDVTVKVVEETK